MKSTSAESTSRLMSRRYRSHAVRSRRSSAMRCSNMCRTQAGAITEMVRVLRPGGFLHLAVPFNQPFHVLSVRLSALDD